MVLVGAVILPHGTMSFDGQGSENSVESCRERYKGLPNDLQVQVLPFFSFIKYWVLKQFEKVME